MHTFDLQKNYFFDVACFSVLFLNRKSALISGCSVQWPSGSVLVYVFYLIFFQFSFTFSYHHRTLSSCFHYSFSDTLICFCIDSTLIFTTYLFKIVKFSVYPNDHFITAKNVKHHLILHSIYCTSLNCRIFRLSFVFVLMLPVTVTEFTLFRCLSSVSVHP